MHTVDKICKAQRAESSASFIRGAAIHRAACQHSRALRNVMSITAKELAKKLNLSPAAVSMALNHKPGVSTATRRLVFDTAEKYGYDFSRISEKNSITGSIYFVIYKKHGAVVTDTPFFFPDFRRDLYGM